MLGLRLLFYRETIEICGTTPTARTASGKDIMLKTTQPFSRGPIRFGIVLRALGISLGISESVLHEESQEIQIARLYP